MPVLCVTNCWNLMELFKTHWSLATVLTKNVAKELVSCLFRIINTSSKKIKTKGKIISVCATKFVGIEFHC